LINPALAGLAVPIETLTPDPENARIHDDRNIALIMESLTRYGQQTPLVVRGGVVLKGNATLEAAKRLGWREIAAIPFHQKTGVRGYKLVDNRAAELAAWGPILGGELQKLMDDGEDMGALGWNKDELEPYFREEAEAKDVIPKVPKVAVTKLGDVIKLGRHILFCGDSTDPDTMVRLAPYGPAALIFTSPPYWVGMPYEYQENVKEIDEFIFHAAMIIVDMTRKDNGRIIINTGTGNGRQFSGEVETLLLIDRWANALRGYGWLLRHLRMWVKSGGLPAIIPPRNDFIDQHSEFIGTFYHPDGKQRGQNRVGEPWVQQGFIDNLPGKATQESAGEHCASFPLELPRRFIRLYTLEEETVFDPFGGAGTTLIACENQGRRCVMVERDPRYCDVIIERFKNFTQLDTAKTT